MRWFIGSILVLGLAANAFAVEVVAGRGVKCRQRGSKIYCNVDRSAAKEVERSHALSLGAGWNSGLNSASAFEGVLSWDLKWLDQRNRWVPKTLLFNVTHDLEEYDANPRVQWFYPGVSRSDSDPPCCRPRPGLVADSPEQTRFGVSMLWRLTK